MGELAQPRVIRVRSPETVMDRANYDAESRKKGYIEVPDRQGRLTRFPFVGLAIGVVANERRPFESVSQIAALGAEH